MRNINRTTPVMLGPVATPKRQKPSDALECTTSVVMYWVLRFSKLLGVAPVALQREGDLCRVKYEPTIVTTAPAVIIILASIALKLNDFVDLILVSHEKRLREQHEKARISVVLMLHIITLFTAVSVVGSSWRRLKCIIKCLHYVQKMKAAMGNDFNIKNRLERRHLIAITVVFFGTALISTFLFIRHVYMEGTSTLTNIGTTFDVMVTLCLVLQFKFTVLEMYVVLKIINDMLEHMLYPVHAKKHRNKCLIGQSQARLPKRIDVTLRELSTAYTSLCKLTAVLNEGTEFGIVFVVLFCFCHLLSMMYFLILQLSTNSNFFLMMEDHFLVISIKLIWLISIVEPCHMMQREVEQTKQLISKLTSKYSDDRISTEIDYFSRSLVQNQMEFVPLGLFSLGRSLIVSILAMSTSYVVIIIQFQS